MHLPSCPIVAFHFPYLLYQYTPLYLDVIPSDFLLFLAFSACVAILRLLNLLSDLSPLM